jgi:HlyD family type I secretion membrane fusion protein
MSAPLANPNNLPISRRQRAVVGDVIGTFESETAAVLVRTTPKHEHIILYVLVTLVVLAFGLSSVVKLDKVVTSSGRIVPVAGELYISPLDSGIVRDVRVKVGDVVKKGEVLATLDPTFSQADVLQLQQKRSSDEAKVARLRAEIDRRPYVPSGTGTFETLQAGIWQQRQAEYRATLADFDGRIRSADAQAAQAKRDAEEYAKRARLAGDLENMYKPLLNTGYVSKLQWMQAKDTQVEIGRLLADAEHQLKANTETLASLKAQRDAYVQKWLSDAGSELVSVQNDLDATRQDLDKARKLNQLSSLDAPADAVVLKVGKISSGSVAGSPSSTSAQDPLFTLVPLDAPLEADINVNARDIGFIKVGDTVRLKLDAYRFLQHGTAKGVIKTISEGSFTLDDNNQPVEPYFKVRVRITDVHLHNVPPDFRLIPGMTLTGDIMVGRRTILSYLVEGALRTGSEAMREP